MTDEFDKNDPLDSTIDGEVGRILDRFLDARENGEAISRDELLAQHPAYADRLAECLAGIELLDSRSTASDGSRATFADFEIRGELGRGGMGVVYEAYQKSLDRIVALKVMRFGVVDPRALERFQREAETAGGLHHTNIVPVYATGREGDTSWYAMQRIEGESLAQRIEDAYRSDAPAKVPVEEVVRIGLQAAEALDYAHQRDVIHRDVKPANLIVDLEDCVWLTDFGLARRLVDVGATMTGALMGTPRYMSPEQADVTRVDVDHHSDIYSLGATLYELATGHPPFEGDDPLQVITRIREAEPRSPRSLRADVPRDLEVVLLKCLAKEPHRRYSSARALADDLRAIAEDRPIKARAMSMFERATRWSKKHRSVARSMAIAVLLTTAALICGFFAVTAWQRSLLGQFRMRAGGGPYTADIRRIGDDGPELTPTTITVPMQTHETLTKGDYEMQLAVRGRWSETVRFPIGGGTQSELKFRTDNEVLREISIADSQAIVVSDGDDESRPPDVLRFHGGELTRFSANPDRDWTLQCDEIECRRTLLSRTNLRDSDSSQTEPNVEKVTVDFGYERSLKRPWAESTLNPRPRKATPMRAVRTPIDLDADGRNDVLIASIVDSAMMAVDADGNVLWARQYQFGAPRSPVTARNNWIPDLIHFVLDMSVVGDQNEDGIVDFAGQIVRIQPGVKNDVCIAMISGRTGEVLKTIDTRAIVPMPPAGATSCPWPQQGILESNSYRQRQSSIRVERDKVRRSQSSEVNSVFWSPGNVGSKFALPFPLAICQRGDNVMAIQTVGSGIQCNGLSMVRSSTPIDRFELPIDAPKVATMDGGGTQGVIVYHEQRIMACGVDGRIMWEGLTETSRGQNQQYFNTRRFELNESDAYRASWPVIADLNGDGIDEILLSPGDSNHTGVWMLDAATGKLLWDEYAKQYATFADKQINRLVVTADINGDGWRDVATASFGGRAESVNSERLLKGEVFVYVDWLSGKNGEKLTWARHPVRFPLSNIRTLELDAIRSGEFDGKSIIEVELVVADSHAEHELEAATLRFSPEKQYATAIAQGLTVCTESENVVKRARWYRKRPGAYSLDEEKLVLLPEVSSSTRLLGEQTPIANWTAADGSPRIVLWGDDPFRVAVHDLERNRTLWTTDATVLAQTVLPVRRGDRTDLAIQFQRFDGKSRVHHCELRSGETGETIWRTEGEFGERMIHAQSIPAQDGRFNTIVVCRGNRLTTKSDGLVMTLVSPSGRIPWSREVLRKASAVNTPQLLPDYGVVDVNGDGVPDIIGADTTTGGMLMLAARDGRTGDVIWRHLWDQPGHRTDYVPNPWAIVSVEGKPAIAILDVNASENGTTQNALAKIVMCDARTGDVLFSHETDCRSGQPSYVSLVNCSPTDDDVRIGVWLRDEKFKPVWMELSVKSDHLKMVEASRVSGLAGYASVWAVDADGDGVPDPFASEKGELLRLSRSTGKTLWRTQMRTDDLYRRFEIFNGVIATWLDGQRPTTIDWLDVESGETIHTSTVTDFSQSARYPTGAKPVGIVATARDGNNAKSFFVVPTNDGIQISESASEGEDAGRLPGLNTLEDPRWQVRPKIGVVSPHGNLRDAILQGVIATAFVTLVVVMPLSYVRKMYRDRRWSLRFFLIAPIVVVTLVTTWRSGLVKTNSDELLVTFIIGLSWLFAGFGIWHTLRHWRWMRWLLPLFLATAFALIMSYYVRRNAYVDSFRYVIGPSEITAAMITSLLQVGGLCGWAVMSWRVIKLIASRFTNRSSSLAGAS